MRSLVSNSIYAKKDRNGPPSAKQVASKDKPRRGHAVCTHPPPPVPPFLLTQNLSPKAIAGSDIMKLSLMTLMGTMGLKGLKILWQQFDYAYANRPHMFEAK